MKWYVQRSGGSLAVSIAVHVVVIMALTQIAFRFPLGQLMGIPDPETTQERLQYIAVERQPTENSGGGYTHEPAKSAAPAALQPPTTIATKVPVPVPSDSSRAQAAGAEGSGLGVTGSGLATGLVPRQPDPRIALSPGTMIRVPRTRAEDVDSIVDVAIGIYNDSIGLYARQRKPGDWTVKGKDGQTWGWDETGIRLGKFTIPQALLAMLPLNVNSGVSPIEARSAAYIRRDILDNAQRSISEDEFRAAVKRIRERKEREKRQKMLASDTKDTTARKQ